MHGKDLLGAICSSFACMSGQTKDRGPEVCSAVQTIEEVGLRDTRDVHVILFVSHDLIVSHFVAVTADMNFSH